MGLTNGFLDLWARGGGPFISFEKVSSRMSPATHRCTCGATLEYKQDLAKVQGGVYPTWLCRRCRTPVPGRIAERIKHQHPS